MRSAIIGLSLFLVVSVLIGCSKSGSSKRTHEDVVKDAVSSMKTVADSMNGVRDAASAQRAEETIRKETNHMQQLKDELAALGQPSSRDKERVKKHSQEVIDASKRIPQATAATMAIIQSGQLPHDTGTRLATAINQYGKAVEEFGKQAGRFFD